MLFLLLISLSSGTTVSKYTSNKYVTEYSCSVNYELCRSCSSDTIYELEDLSAFEISGYLSSTIKTVKSLISDLQSSISSQQTFLSLTSKQYCLSYQKIDSVSYSTLLQTFLNIEYYEYNLPQLDSDPELYQVLLISKKGSGKSYYVENIKIDYDLDTYYTVADQIVLETKIKRLDLYKDEGGTLSYYGIADATVLYPRFICTLEYGIEPDMVEVKVNTNAEVLLGEWNNATNYVAGCNDIDSPAGLDSVDKLAVNRSVLIFEVSDGLDLKEFINFVYPPDFAITQGIYIEDIEGKMSAIGGSCSLTFQGTWESKKSFNIILSASENSAYTMQASLSNSPYELSLNLYSKILNTLYLNYTGLFPIYSQSPELVTKMLSINLENPVLKFSFIPEANVTVSGSARLSNPGDIDLKLATSRKDSLIKTEGYIKTNDSYTLLDISALSDPDFYLKSSVVSFDSSDINVNTSIYLDCQNSTVCLALKNSYNNFTVTGEYFPGDFYLKYSLGTINILDLELSNAEVLLNISDSTINVNGTCDLDISGSAYSVFEGRLLSKSSSANWHSSIKKEVKGLPGSSSLFVFYASFVQTMNQYRVLNYKIQGLCGYKSSDERWAGDLDSTISEYKVNKYECLLPYKNTSDALKYLASMRSADSLIAYIEFPYGFKLDYDEFFILTQPISILGLTGTSYCRSQTLPSSLFFKLELNDWNTGFSNIKVSGSTGKLEVFSTYSEAEIKGNFSLWEVNQEAVLTIKEEIMSFSLYGYFFSGLYYVNITFTADLNDFSSASWLGKFELSEEYVSDLSYYVNNTLVEWVLDGRMVLQDGLSLVYYYDHLVENATYDLVSGRCKYREYCSSEIEYKCIKKAKQYECTDLVYSCDPEIICVDYENSCFNDNCTESVNYCEEYEELCSYSDEKTQCINRTVEEIGKECLRFANVYQKTLMKDQNCVQNMEFYDDVYGFYRGYYEMLNETYYKNLELLEGFLMIDVEFIFDIQFIMSRVILTEPGQNDVEVLVVFDHWLDNEYTTTAKEVIWSFTDSQKNVDTLVNLIKSEIVVNSEMFSNELIGKSPREVYLETLYQVSSN